MRIIYADTSALARAYFADEPEHFELRRALLDGTDAVVTSELSRVELAGAVRSAERSGRLRRVAALLDRIEANWSDDGPLALARFDPGSMIPTARVLVLEHRLRTLDALHLAAAISTVLTVAPDDEFALVTRDRDQAIAATAIGLTLR